MPARSAFLLPIFAIQIASAAPLPPEHIEWRILETDPKTATFLREAVAADDQDAGKLAGQLDDLISRNKITERARFVEQVKGLDRREARIETKKVDKELSVDPELTIELGVHLDTDVGSGPHRCSDTRATLEINSPLKGKRYREQSVTTGFVFPDGRWTLAGSWGDAAQETLALVRNSFTPRAAKGTPSSSQDPIRTASLAFDLYKTTASDLQTVTEKSAGREGKALTWLRGRASLERHCSVITNPGQRIEVEDVLPYVHDDGDGPFLHEPGLIVMALASIGAEGELVDVEFFADLRREKNRAENPDFIFSGPRTLLPGVPAFFAGKPSAADNEDTYVLVVTPTVVTHFAGRLADRPPVAAASPREGPYQKTYTVHPAFHRLLGGEGLLPDPRDPVFQNPGLVARPTLKEQLIGQGLPFPQGTQAFHLPRGCRVILRHSEDGHQQFEALLKKFTPPE